MFFGWERKVVRHHRKKWEASSRLSDFLHGARVGEIRVNVVTEVAAADLCVGCGVCAGVCPAQCLAMESQTDGLYRPVVFGTCVDCGLCLRVCPFSSQPTSNEGEMANALFGSLPNDAVHPVIGHWQAAYEARARGREIYGDRSSGGLSTWMLCKLLDSGTVDSVACVVPTTDPPRRFEYRLLSRKADVQVAAKSCYYPVELSQVIRHLLQNKDKRVAIIGLPCYVKALRLACKQVPSLHEAIPFMIGLTCGQLKTKQFAEYLLAELGVGTNDASRISFREREPGRPMRDFCFSARVREHHAGAIPFSAVYGEIWKRPEFTPLPCLFCDDVFAEVADATSMDAWLPRFEKSRRGANLVVVRADRVAMLLADGARRRELLMRQIDIEDVVGSQRGVIRRKRRDLAVRLATAASSGSIIPRKRVSPTRGTLHQRIHAAYELKCSKLSREEFRRLAGTGSTAAYRAAMRRKLWMFRAYFLAERILRWSVRRLGRAVPSILATSFCRRCS